MVMQPRYTIAALIKLNWKKDISVVIKIHPKVIDKVITVVPMASLGSLLAMYCIGATETAKTIVNKIIIISSVMNTKP